MNEMLRRMPKNLRYSTALRNHHDLFGGRSQFNACQQSDGRITQVSLHSCFGDDHGWVNDELSLLF